MIPFNRPPYTGDEDKYVLQAMCGAKQSGDGVFGKKCQAWFEDHLGCFRALLVPSCTHALEMAAMLIDIKPGDEVIMPSYTFVSTANAFVLKGAKIIFVDVEPGTMNMDVRCVKEAITKKTRAIVPVHYAGVSCDMDALMQLADQYDIFVIEDAAQGMMATYNDKPLGTIGHLGAFSFHDTKNYTSGGEGGLLIINDERFLERAEIIREKGTNRSQFFRGMVDKYSWVDVGSSYLMSDLQAAYLWGQLENADRINKERLAIWEKYRLALAPLEEQQLIQLPEIPDGRVHNAHMFFIKCRDLDERSRLIEHLAGDDITAVFHYVPLHSAKAGKQHGAFCGRDWHTTKEADRLLRLPMFMGLSVDDQDRVIASIKRFWSVK